VVLYEIYSKKSKVANTFCTTLYPWKTCACNSSTQQFIDKQIKFKDFCVSWNKFHKNLPRDSFNFFLMWFYMKYIVKNRRWRILFALICIHEKPVPATVLPNNLDTETKTSDCTPNKLKKNTLKKYLKK